MCCCIVITTTPEDTTTNIVTTTVQTTVHATTTPEATTTVEATTTTIATTTQSPTTTVESSLSEATSTAFTTTTSAETTTTSAQLSELTTTTTESTSTQPPDQHYCCCRCCYQVTSSPTSSCTVCGDESLAGAQLCAAQPPPTRAPFVRPTEPNFEPPAQLVGSKFAERLAFTEEFLAKEKMTETLASASLAEKIAVGFTVRDFIVDCSYDGTPCVMDTYVYQCVRATLRSNLNHCKTRECSLLKTVRFSVDFH